MKDLLTAEQWKRNVGTESYPVTFLHEYAVGLIWDLLQTALKDNEPIKLPLIDGAMSENVLDDVAQISFPDSLQAIGGYIPDLALFDRNIKVLRVIEVVVTSHSSQEKLDNLTKRGVEVLQVPVRNEADLRALAPEHSQGNGIRWWHQTYRREGRGRGVNFRSYTRIQNEADEEVSTFIRNLVQCSPTKRRELVAVLETLHSLDSLYPLRRDNPKRDKLQGSEAPSGIIGS